MKKEIVTIQKNIEHPLEAVFDIEPKTTEVVRTEQRTVDLAVVPEYDEKDQEIEEAMQEVYDKAMSGYERIQDECEDIEGRYLPRMMEVGVQHLKMALDAAEAKAKIKELKDKLSGKAKAGPKTVNNNVVISREDLLRTLFNEENEDQQ